MSYLFPKGPNNRLKIYKIPVSTPENKTLQNGSDFNYTVDLPYTITNVVGIALVEWSLPRDMVPSFYPPTTRLPGNNKLDFRLFNPDIAAAPADFTATFPTKFFQYQDVQDPSFDYTVAVQQLMNAAIDADPVWAGKVRIMCSPQSLNQTLLETATVDQALPANSSTSLGLLFASGPNSGQAANEAMGWPTKADYFSSPTFFYLRSGTQSLESPAPTQLRVSNYLDVFVEESSVRPLKRIFVQDNNYTSNIYNSEAINRFTVDLDNPPRLLRQLHISIRFENQGDPGDFMANPIIVPHALTFHIVSLVDENQPNPTYVNQSMTY